MKKQLDIRQILSVLIVTGIVASIGASMGAVLDFRDLKKQVVKHEVQIGMIGMVVCEYAIRDNLPESSSKCKQMLGGDK